MKAYEIEYTTDQIYYDCQIIEEDKREEFIQNILDQPGGKLINNGGRRVR